MYLPDGDRLRKNGFFITPNARREGIFDLQNLSQEACAHFLAMHETDLEGFKATKDTIERFFKETQIKRITWLLRNPILFYLHVFFYAFK